MNSISVGGKSIGNGSRPYLIAEIGTNYRHDLDLAKAMVEAASAAGADAAKFQTHIAADEMVESAMADLGFADLFNRISQYEMSIEEHSELRDHCMQYDLEFLSTPFSTDAVEILEAVGVPAYKIGSGELSNHHLLKRAAETGKPLLISTGMSDWNSLEHSVSFVRDHAERIALLYCVSSYPTEPSEFNLGVIDRMKAAFDVPVGFSDHSQGIQAAATAMARGADFVEKHFTLDRRLPGGDQEVSLEPEEFAELAEFADIVHQTRGRDKSVSSEEESLQLWAHHSVVTRTGVEAGETFTLENLTTKRPGTGVPAREYFEVIGREAARSIEADTIVSRSDIVG